MNLALRIPKPATIVSKLRGKGVQATSAISVDELDAVCRLYPLKEWRIAAVLGGSNSTNLLLETEQGPQVLKRYHWSLPSTLQEHSILRHLEEAEFPTARLLRNCVGETCTVMPSDAGEHHYAFYEYVRGYELHQYLMLNQVKRKAVAHAGKTLAEFHRIMVGFLPEGRKFNGFHPENGRLWRDGQWHINIVNRFRGVDGAASNSPRLTLFLREVADELSALLQMLGDLFEQVDPELPRVVIHGDYGPHNLLYQNGQVQSVLDLGDACVNLRALDLARGVATFTRTGLDDIDLSLAKAFLDGYRQVQTIHDRELKMLNNLLQWRYAQNMLWKLETVDPLDPTIDRHLEAIQQKWESICRLQETVRTWDTLPSGFQTEDGE